MELTVKDKAENSILVMIVIPKNDRLYNYYINGQSDKRTMLQRKMLEFCLNLCPSHAREIRKSIFQLIPFIVYPESNVFETLEEQDPPAINRRELLFPMGKLVRQDKIDLSKKENDIQKMGKQFNIWEKYGIHLDIMKKAETKKNGLLSAFLEMAKS
jgi:hypothetical protein